jgi:hypothetical protein
MHTEDPVVSELFLLEALKARRTVLANEHAQLWLQISFSAEWQRFVRVEGALAALDAFLKEQEALNGS